MIQPRLRAALVIGAIVVASGITGAAIDRAFVTRTAAASPTEPRAPGGDGRRGGGDGGGRRGGSYQEQEARRRTEMLDRMTRELTLTPAQRAGFDSVFRRTDSSVAAVRREMQPRLRQVYETAHTELRVRLDSAQLVKFAAMRRHVPGRGRGDGYPGRGSGDGRQK